MKNLNKLFTECMNEVSSIGIDVEPIIDVSVNYRAKRRFGEARGFCKDGVRVHTINISSEILRDEANTNEVKNTIVHEILHCTKGGNGHKGNWEKLANKVNRELGYHISRCSSYESFGIKRPTSDRERESYQYEFKCQGCGQIIRRKRQSKFVNNYKNYRCGICGGDFNRIY